MNADPDNAEQITAVLIAGPTASGKSRLALELAEEFDGEIVNADAMQVYQDLRILTARPSVEEENRVPHHLYGVMDGAARCSAGIWARQASSVIADSQARGRMPIIVGGTGLYFRALIEGLSPIPEVSNKIRAEAQGLHEKLGAEAFRRQVLEVDPSMMRLEVNDRQRLIRAWEVYQATGTPLSEFQSLPREPLLTSPFRKICLMPPRDVLYRNCDSRFKVMLEEGALEEVKSLKTRDLDPALPVMKSLGVPELSAHLRGNTSLEEAVEKARTNTRRFAKRQMTWFRGQASDWEHLANWYEAPADILFSKQT